MCELAGPALLAEGHGTSPTCPPMRIDRLASARQHAVMRRTFDASLAFLTVSALVVGCAPGAETPGPAPEDVVTPPVDATIAPDLAPAADASPAPGPFDAPGQEATVVAFDGRHVFFTGADNQRTVETTASFPDTGSYAKITLYLTLTCPDGGCDAWDRRGAISLVAPVPGPDGPRDVSIELLRFITPFGVGLSASQDLTDLRPLLRGEVRLRTFIDTWVGPGSPYGAGWRVTAIFIFEGGAPSRLPIAVIPLHTERAVPYGDPAQPPEATAPPITVALPEGASSAAIRALITGHGQGNADNCAEFCARDHTLTVAPADVAFPAVAHTRRVWRDDCPTTAAPDQRGTWRYPRAGWCPGALVEPWTVDLPAAALPSRTLTVAYAPEPWVNTCRPDASPCSGCVFDTGCAYNDSSHTQPFHQVSTLLIAYR